MDKMPQFQIEIAEQVLDQRGV